MNESKISVRYAKALFQAADEAKVLIPVMKDMELIMNYYFLPDFRAVIESPVVKTSDKKKVCEKLFSGNISPLSMTFIELLLSNKRESHLPHIARNFKSLFRKNQGILSAEIIVSEPIDKEQSEKFRSLLKKTFNSEIELEETLKPSILGGFILRVEDEQFDGSVSSGLAKIKKQLLESTLVK
jgi:F-type H+-transporting ATPase subunit delta